MVSARMSAAAAFAVFAVVASSDHAGHAISPEAEEEEAHQMNVKLLQVGTSTQRSGREDHQAFFDDEEEDHDEVELAQVRFNVKRGLHKVGISADGGVRARGAGIAGTVARGRVAFRVAGDGSMVLDSDDDDDVLLGRVQLLQTKTQMERPPRAAEAGMDSMFVDEGSSDEGSAAVDGLEANQEEDGQGAEDDDAWLKEELLAEDAAASWISAEHAEEGLPEEGQDLSLVDKFGSEEDDLAAWEEGQREELLSAGTQVRHAQKGLAKDGSSLEVRRLSAGGADDEETPTVEEAPFAPAADDDVSLSEFFDVGATDAEETPPVEEAMSTPVDDDDVSLGEVQLLQTKTRLEPVRIVQHRGVLSADNSLLSVRTTATDEVADEDQEQQQERAGEDDGAYEAEEEQEQPAEDDGSYEAYDANDEDGPAVEEASNLQLADDTPWEVPDDINEDSAQVALIGLQQGSVADTAADADGDSSPSGLMQAEQDFISAFEDGDDDSLAEDALVEVSAMTDPEREELYEELLDEAAATPVLAQEGSFVDIAADTEGDSSQSESVQAEEDALLANEDGDRDALTEDALVELSAMTDLEREGLYEELLEDEPVEDGPALFGEGMDVPQPEAPTKPLLTPERGGVADVGLSLLQIDEALEQLAGDAAEAEDETFFSAEAAMLSTQLMQQDVVTLMQKPVAPVADDGTDDHVGLLSGIPVAAGRNTVTVDQDGELREVEADEDRSHSVGSGRVAMEVSPQGYARWE